METRPQSDAELAAPEPAGKSPSGRLLALVIAIPVFFVALFFWLYWPRQMSLPELLAIERAGGNWSGFVITGTIVRVEPKDKAILVEHPIEGPMGSITLTDGEVEAVVSYFQGLLPEGVGPGSRVRVRGEFQTLDYVSAGKRRPRKITIALGVSIKRVD